MLIPLCNFDRITLSEANELLVKFDHKMGPLHRGNGYERCHALFHEGVAVGVVTTSTLIRPRVGNAPHFTRENTVELSRLAAARPGLCRVVLRLWREFVFPTLGYEFAVSYQDADIHRGEIYRCDGWRRVAYSRSGTDKRSGRKGRNKWVWIWPPPKNLVVTDAAPDVDEIGAAHITLDAKVESGQQALSGIR